MLIGGVPLFLTLFFSCQVFGTPVGSDSRAKRSRESRKSRCSILVSSSRTLTLCQIRAAGRGDPPDSAARNLAKWYDAAARERETKKRKDVRSGKNAGRQMYTAISGKDVVYDRQKACSSMPLEPRCRFQPLAQLLGATQCCICSI